MERDRLGGADEGVPADLAREIRGLYSGRAVVQSRVDEAVLAVASRRAAAGRARKRLRIGAWGLAAAAGLAMAGVVWMWGGPPQRGTGQPQDGLAGSNGANGSVALDVNGDGVVDIVDALVLGRAVEGKLAGRDVTGDGAVDRKDVDRVAMAAVNLGKGG